jgi:predicted dehydrogenase
MATRRETLTQIVAGATLAVAGRRATAADLKATPPAGGSGRIRIGQIGVGHAHANKLEVYRRSPDYEVVGIVEADPALMARAEGQAVFQGLPWMTQEQLLNQPGLQAVLVETEVRRSLDVAEACVAAGKHIHIDKPPGTSLVQLRRVLDDAKRQGVLVQQGYMYRYNPGIVLLRQLVHDGWLGEIFEAHAAMSKLMPPQSRRELAAYPGGTLFEFGGYLIDMIFKVLGPTERVTGFTQHAAALDDTLVDNGLAVLTYPRALATIRSSGLEVQGQDRRQFVVCGNEGTCQVQPLDNPTVRLTLAKPRGEYKAGTQEIRMPRYERYVDDAADMARVIRGEKPTDFPYEHDFAVQRALFQACGLPLDR